MPVAEPPAATLKTAPLLTMILFAVPPEKTNMEVFGSSTTDSIDCAEEKT